MRVWMVKRAAGDVDGFPLDQFEVGNFYEIDTSIATYLVVIGCATPVIDESPPPVIPAKRGSRTLPPLSQERRRRKRPTRPGEADS